MQGHRPRPPDGEELVALFPVIFSPSVYWVGPGDVAQMVERSFRIREVWGSMPHFSNPGHGSLKSPMVIVIVGDLLNLPKPVFCDQFRSGGIIKF